MPSSKNLDGTDTNPETYLDDGFKQWVQSLMDEFHVPGLSVAVVYNGQTDAAGYGLAQLPGVSATADTIYGMGSTTKQFTAALLGLLIEESAQTQTAKDSDDRSDALSWSTPIKSILKDDFMLSDKHLTDNVSIEDMLSHRTGIPGHDLLLGPWLSTPLESTRILQHLKANAPFRTKCQYNNLIYGILGHVIETLTKQPFSTATRKRIFEPLGMNNTFIGLKEASEAFNGGRSSGLQFARGYCWINEDFKTSQTDDSTNGTKGYYVADPHSRLEPLDPAGAIMSSVLDYAKWVSELLKASVEPSNGLDKESSESNQVSKLISNELWKELTTPRAFWLPAGAPFSQMYAPRPNLHVNTQTYSLGLHTDPYMYPGEVAIGHGGGMPCFGSLIHIMPNLNFGVVVAANTAGSSNILSAFIAKELVGRRLGLSREERRRRYDDGTKEEPKEKPEPQLNASQPEFVQEILKLIERPTESNHTPGSDAHLTFYLSDQAILLPPEFSNTAYGAYAVSLAPKEMSWIHRHPVYKDVPIIRKSPQLITSHNEQATQKGAHVIHIRPLGARSIICEFLLHPSAIKDNKIVYDLEHIERHGLPRPDRGDEPDPFPNLPPGHGKSDDEKYPYRDTQLWMSANLKMSGGVLVLTRQENQEDKGFVVEKIGLRLARIEEAKGGKSGVLEKGWAEKMEWFLPERA